MAHVFISYVHENEQEVQKLCAELTRRGLEVWLDKIKIKPGHDWKDAIDEAIERGDFFLACFSEEYNQKNETYMTEELNLAIERLRKQPRSRAWFIPVLLSGQIPNWRTLVPLRKTASSYLSGDQVRDMLRQHNIYCAEHDWTKDACLLGCFKKEL